jgi:hypothetical protein
VAEVNGALNSIPQSSNFRAAASCYALKNALGKMAESGADFAGRLVNRLALPTLRFNRCLLAALATDSRHHSRFVRSLFSCTTLPRLVSRLAVDLSRPIFLAIAATPCSFLNRKLI